MTHWILTAQGEPQQVDDVMVWARWFQAADRHLAQDMHEGEGAERVRVSTVFLGLDHRFGSLGPPILWETLVFGGALDGESERYSSREDAYLGHLAMCERVRLATAECDVSSECP